MTLILLLLALVLLLVLAKPELTRIVAPWLSLLLLILVAVWAALLRIYINIAELIILAFLTLLVYIVSMRSR